MKKERLTHIFYKYFYEKIDFAQYDVARKSLEHVINENKIDIENKTLILFVVKYYQMKNIIKTRYKNIQNYLNSIEGNGEPLLKKISMKKHLNELSKLHNLCDKFESQFFDVYHISLIRVKNNIDDAQNLRKRKEFDNAFLN